MKKMEEMKRPDKYPSYYSREISERVREQVLEKGRPVHKIVYKTSDPADKFKGVKASDFDLEVLISLGALDSAKTCALSSNDLEASDIVETVDNSISSQINSNDGGDE